METSAVARLRGRVTNTFLPRSARLSTVEAARTAAASALFVLLSIPLLTNWRSFPAPGESVWAEDGAIFMQQGLRIPWSTAVLQPYAGYMHFVPRTVMALVLLLPADDWAIAIALTAIVIRSLLAVFVFHALAGHLPSRMARALVAVVMVTIPLGGTEVLNNLANLHWFLLVATVPALLWRPATWIGTTAQCLVVAAAMLSDPLALVWTPFVLVRLVGLPRIREHAVSAVFGVAAIIQLSVTLGTRRQPGPGMTGAEAAEAYIVRVAEPAFIGIRAAEQVWQSARVVVIVTTVVVASSIMLGGLVRRGPHRGLIAGCSLGSIVFYVIAMGIGSPAGGMLTEPTIRIDAMSRYAAAAGVLLLVAVVAGAWSLASAPRLRPVMAVLSIALAGTYVAGVVSGYGYRSPSVSTVPWTAAVTAAEQACLTPWTLESIQPIDPGGGWLVAIPCRYLR